MQKNNKRCIWEVTVFLRIPIKTPCDIMKQYLCNSSASMFKLEYFFQTFCHWWMSFFSKHVYILSDCLCPVCSTFVRVQVIYAAKRKLKPCISHRVTSLCTHIRAADFYVFPRAWRKSAVRNADVWRRWATLTPAELQNSRFNVYHRCSLKAS